jgi:AcrR family transcriptional regulator
MTVSHTAVKRSDGLDTMARLIEQAKIELEVHGIEKFDIDAVLERAEAARSSLYHHFGSKLGLIHTTQLDLVVNGLQTDNAALRYLIEISPSPEAFFEIFATFVRSAGSPENIKLRHRRTQIFASATTNPQLAAAIKTSQQESTDFLVETLEILRERGWINPPFDMHVVAYAIQTMIFGRLILDFSAQPELDAEWANTTINAILTICGADVSLYSPKRQ